MHLCTGRVIYSPITINNDNNTSYENSVNNFKPYLTAITTVWVPFLNALDPCYEGSGKFNPFTFSIVHFLLFDMRGLCLGIIRLIVTKFYIFYDFLYATVDRDS